MRAYQVDDVSEMNLDTAMIQILVVGGIMDELGELALTHLRSAIAEDKEKCVNSI